MIYGFSSPGLHTVKVSFYVGAPGSYASDGKTSLPDGDGFIGWPVGPPPSDDPRVTGVGVWLDGIADAD